MTMSIDDDLFEEYRQQLADRYTAAELVEEMGLGVWDILEAFREHLKDNYVQPYNDDE